MSWHVYKLVDPRDSTMVERVALAIYRDCCGPESIWEDRYRGPWLEHARAAIAAMREPTDAMIEEGYPLVADEYVDREDLIQAWRDMINTALK